MFEIEVGRDLRKICKNVSHFTQKITPSSNAKQQPFYVRSTLASLPGMRLFCAVWAILASLLETMCHNVHPVIGCALAAA